MHRYVAILCGVFCITSCSHTTSSPAASTTPEASVAAANPATDVHTHIGASDETGHMINAEDALTAARRAHIERAWIIGRGHSAENEADAQRENDLTIAAQTQDPTHLIAVIGVRPQAEWAEREIRRAVAAGGHVIKIHSVTAGLDLTNSADLAHVERVVSLAEELHTPVLIHGSFSRPNEAQALIDLAERHPQTHIVIAHMLGRDLPLLMSLRGQHIFVDVSGIQMLQTDEQRAGVAGILRASGIARFLFASDWPQFEPSAVREALEQFPLTDDERDAILRRNVQRVEARE